MFALLDCLFIVFHSGLVLFNLTGWAWRRTRAVHLATISLTMFSWFGLGIFYGWGYCPFTEWHWRVKRQLGESDLPNSYIKYYADKLTGTDWDLFFVETATVLFATTALVLSCWLNLRDWNYDRRH